MYIHLGRDYVLNDRDIIGIFDLETTTTSPGAGVFELRPEERGGGQPFGRAAPVLCAGRRRAGGCGVSFGAVQRRHAPQSAKDGGVKFAENGRKIHRKKEGWESPGTARNAAPYQPERPLRAARENTTKRREKKYTMVYRFPLCYNLKKQTQK